MAESGREKGSVIVPFNGKEDTTQETKRNPYVIIIVELIILAVILCLFYLIKKYANKNNCGSEFWIYLANGGSALVSACLSALATVLPFIKGVKRFLSTGWRGFTNLTVPIGMFVVGTLSFLCLFTFFDVRGAVEKESEKKNQLTQNSSTQMSSILMSGNNEQESKEVKEVTIYNINQDLHMENRPLEDYYNGEITAENTKSVKAKILYNNLEYNKPNGSTSDDYNKLLETADYQYKTYEFKKDYADEKDNTSEEWFEDRMESLLESLATREEAGKEYESPKNERPIATGYKDKGDEYFGRNDKETAMDAYEQSADWFMKAINHAAAIGDYEEMNTCMTEFRKLGEEVKKIDSSRRNKITEWIEVYEIFVELVSENK